MAVAKNTGDSGTPQAATSFSASVTTISHTGYTIGTGSDIVLIGILTLANSGPTDTTGHAMTWNTSENFTQLGTGIYNNSRVSFWYLQNPTTGNHTATATWTTGSDAVLGLVSFTGGGTPIDATTATDNSDTATADVTSDANGATVAAVSGRANVDSTTSGTQLYLDNSTWVASAAGYTIGGTLNTHTFLVTSTPWAVMGAHIPAAGAGSGTPIGSSLM